MSVKSDKQQLQHSMEREERSVYRLLTLAWLELLAYQKFSDPLQKNCHLKMGAYGFQLHGVQRHSLRGPLPCYCCHCRHAKAVRCLFKQQLFVSNDKWLTRQNKAKNPTFPIDIHAGVWPWTKKKDKLSRLRLVCQTQVYRFPCSPGSSLAEAGYNLSQLCSTWEEWWRSDCTIRNMGELGKPFQHFFLLTWIGI